MKFLRNFFNKRVKEVSKEDKGESIEKQSTKNLGNFDSNFSFSEEKGDENYGEVNFDPFKNKKELKKLNSEKLKKLESDLIKKIKEIKKECDVKISKIPKPPKMPEKRGIKRVNGVIVEMSEKEIDEIINKVKKERFNSKKIKINKEDEQEVQQKNMK